MAKVWLDDKCIADIQRVLAKFPEVKRFQLKEHSQSGIGSCLDMVFDTEVNGVKCKMIVPIADESTW
jgi:hypothetical protein